MKLMIVESPKKTKKIQSALGAGWKVVASVGHERDLPAKEMAVDLQTFEPTYQLSERGAQVVSRLKTPVSQSRILCAGGAALEVHGRSVLSPRIGALQILPRWLAVLA